MTVESYEDRYVLRTFGKGKESIHFVVYPFTEKVFVNTLGHGCFLCACLDGITLLQINVGKRKKDLRHFVSIDWLINQWGGSKETIEQLIIKKEQFKNEMLDLKEMIYEDARKKDA
jgi:hypothetical protein